MSNAMDRFKLIAEVRKRPALWDFKNEEHGCRKACPAAWKEVAVAMGSDVTANDCRRMWQPLRDRHRIIVKKIELRIAKDKLNGTYDPNNEDKSHWVFYEHMKFINDIQKSRPMDITKCREMSKAMDRFKLIAEIRKRPALWDINFKEYKSKIILKTAWKDVAVAMGSNVNDCSRTWKSLRSINREVVRKVELRIQKAKLKGSYNPNNDYSTQWPYLKHMEFINGMKLGNSTVNDNTKMEPDRDLEISKVMDKFKLIDEVRKRPPLWDIKSDEHRTRRSHQKAWKDLAVVMGSDVNDCRRIWKNLCRCNRLVVKRMELRIQEAKVNGSYNPNNDYSSKWPYLDHMKFMKSDLEMSKVMDKFKLIDEVRKRPALWDIRSDEHRSCLAVPEVWKDLAVSVGSDVKKCQRNWIILCKVYRRLVKRIESRIKEDNLNGSYDPNNDYSSKWAYFEPLVFLKNIQTGPIKLRTSAEKLILIAEVRKRPEQWFIKSKEYLEIDDCKRKWRSLLVQYRAEVKKLQLRIKEDNLKGLYNPNNEYRCKWFFYEHMKFYYDIKNPSLMELGNTSVNDNNSDDNDSNQVSEFQNMVNNKMEPELDLEPEVYLPDDEHNSPQTSVGVKSNFSGVNFPENQDLADDKPTTSNWKCTKRSYDQANYLEDLEKEEHILLKSTKMELGIDLDPEVYITDDEDYDTDSQMSGMEFLSEPNSPQNQESADDKPSSTGGNCTKQSYDQAILLGDIEKEEHNLINSTKVELGLDLDPEVYIHDDEDYDTDSQMSGMEFLSEPNSPQNQESADDIPSSTGGNCTKRSYDQANLLEDLEKDEHNLIQTVRSNEMVPVTDSDYNFLVSFLPKMKKINELQNLQFRAKITDLMSDIAKE